MKFLAAVVAAAVTAVGASPMFAASEGSQPQAARQLQGAAQSCMSPLSASGLTKTLTDMMDPCVLTPLGLSLARAHPTHSHSSEICTCADHSRVYGSRS